jgi:hypothetical protein
MVTIWGSSCFGLHLIVALLDVPLPPSCDFNDINATFYCFIIIIIITELSYTNGTMIQSKINAVSKRIEQSAE